MAPPLPVTLADLKTHLNLTGTTEDAELTDKPEAATGAVEQRVGPMVIREVSEHTTATKGHLRLWYTPVDSLTSATLSGAVVEVSDWVLAKSTGLVSGVSTDGVYQVVYNAGRAVDALDVPSELREATLVVAAHLWETQRGSTGAAPGVPGQAFASTPVPRGFALPHRAVELLATHASPMVA